MKVEAAPTTWGGGGRCVVFQFPNAKEVDVCVVYFRVLKDYTLSILIPLELPTDVL
jgi:hypothetical protein